LFSTLTASRCLELEIPASKVIFNVASDSKNSADKSATPLAPHQGILSKSCASGFHSGIDLRVANLNAAGMRLEVQPQKL